MASKHALFIAAVCGLLLPSTDGLADCDPTFGDDIYGWVERSASAQSRALADADYQARTFSYFVVGYQAINARLAAVSDHLDGVAARVSADESTSSTAEVRTALARDSSATSLLNDLYMIRASLDEAGRQQAAIIASPALARFRAEGLGNVGRATLLGSLQQLGDAAQPLMSARFSVYVQVNMNDNGQVENAKVERKADMVDTVVYAAASYLPTPYTWLVAAIYTIGRELYETSTCQDRINKQKDRLRDAYTLLPTQLIGGDEQFALYQKYYNANVDAFKDTGTSASALLAKLDERWRELVAYNAARAEAANVILTDAKIAQLQTEYHLRGDVDGLYNDIAIMQMADGLASLNGYLATRQSNILRACADLQGYKALEDQRDALPIRRHPWP